MYQPTITRLPSLLCLFLATIGLITLMEIACRRLPIHNARIVPIVLRRDSIIVNALVLARHANAHPQVYNSSNQPGISTGAPSPDDFLPISAAPSAFIGTSTHSVTPQDYALGAFIPIILAVLFGIPWHILASTIKEIEPFYQLYHAEGALVEDSLTLDYRASINVIATFNAIRKGHFLVWWSGLVSISILFLAPLASESVFIGFINGVKCTATSGRDACVPVLSVYPVAARLVQGILVFVAVLTFALGLALWRKQSGVYANPLSIAGLATLFQDENTVQDFRRLNAYARNTKDLSAALHGIRYRVGEYTDAHGYPAHGIMRASASQPVVSSHHCKLSISGRKYASVAVDAIDEKPAPSERRKGKKIPISSIGGHPATIIVFILFASGLLCLVIYYKQVGANTGFERFMASESFGASFLFTAFGVILKMYWTFLDDGIGPWQLIYAHLRTNTPYRLLSTLPRSAASSILLSSPSNPFTGLFHSVAHSQWLNVYTSLVAILCEPLIISLANIPFKPGTAVVAYIASTWIVVIVLVMMILGCLCVLFSRMKSRERRAPETLAGVLALLCGSHMLSDFRGMARLGKEERDRIVSGWGNRYALGNVVGVDGVERETIDEAIFVKKIVPSRT